LWEAKKSGIAEPRMSKQITKKTRSHQKEGGD